MALEWISRACFSLVHRHSLVYNACWEDPRIDRDALDLNSDDDVLVITSAGCNALDYVLAGARRVFAVDINAPQNSLLELKLAGIRQLEFPDFFSLFGRGRLENWKYVYSSRLRPVLSPAAQRYWDRRGRDFFASNGPRNSFYFHGSSGWFAFVANRYVSRTRRLYGAMCDLLDAKTVDEQREIYERHNVRESLFRPLTQWILRRDTTLALVGVPRSQRRQIDRGYPGGIAGFIMDRVEAVFSRRPLGDNYFWRVYLTGQYAPTCCPEYLLSDNFQRLKESLLDRVSVHTTSLVQFLRNHSGRLSKIVLLDHMDWLYENFPDLLAAEWQAIVDRAAPYARVIWRSAGFAVDFVDPIEVRTNRGTSTVGDLLKYDRELAATLHARDRVHTYGSFYVATLAGT
ncbi:MAG TPA: BtaA family protein [Planctomycetaceae bacterium]|nr:BtaA family protein [Planctomycetaceae bacterium]